MNAEFENFLSILESPNSENIPLAFQVSANYKKEIEEYYKCSYKKWRALYKYCVVDDKYQFFSFKDAIPIHKLYTITFDDFFDDLQKKSYRKFSNEDLKELKRIVSNRRYEKIAYFCNPLNCKIRIRYWQIIKHLII